MRALIISHSYQDASARGKLRALTGLGVHLTVGQPGGVAQTDAGVRLVPIEVANPGADPPSLSWNRRAIRRLLWDLRPDIIQVEEEPDTQGAAAVAKEARRLGVPYVAFSWESLPVARTLLDRRRYQQVVREATGLMGGNRLATAILEQHAPGRPTTTLPQHGINLPPAPDRPADPTEVPLHLVTVGRLVPERGTDMLLRALAQVYGQWHLEVIGTGPEQETLEALAQRLGLASRLVWRGGLDRADVDAQWGRYECLVIPARATEGWVERFSPMLIRAMGAEVAPVVTGVGALPEIVGDAGVVVTSEGELTAALQGFTEDRIRLRQLGQAARRRVLQEFAETVVAERTLQFWERCLALPSEEAVPPQSSQAG